MRLASLLRHRHATAWVLALALLAAQALGLAHSVAHAPGLASVAAVADEHFDGHHAGDAECRLIDQLAHADALVAGALLLPPALPAVLSAPALPPAHTVAFAAGYLARAPPRA
jgi:hypothetical protein